MPKNQSTTDDPEADDSLPASILITDVFDLHSIAPRDIEVAVEEYLLEAQKVGLRALRIIHGRGIGAQRETVRRVLARTPFVASCADAPMEAGGWGATVVNLRHENLNREGQV